MSAHGSTAGVSLEEFPATLSAFAGTAQANSVAGNSLVKEKDRHPWQRSLAEYLHFTKYLTKPGEWVLDVTAGSFASGKAAKLLGRNYIGVDIDKAAVAKGREWIADGE